MTADPDTSEPDSTPRRYHHGNLAGVLVDATIDLVRDGGLDNVSVREAALRAGVSAGAPFRHFRTKTALMTAAAEKCVVGLMVALTGALAGTSDDKPVEAMAAFAYAYVDWTQANPTDFEIIHAHSIVDFAGSKTLSDASATMNEGLLARAVHAGRIGHVKAQTDPVQAALLVRAGAYGLSRMVNEHSRQGAEAAASARQAAYSALSLMIAGLRA